MGGQKQTYIASYNILIILQPGGAHRVSLLYRFWALFGPEPELSSVIARSEELNCAKILG